MSARDKADMAMRCECRLLTQSGHSPLSTRTYKRAPVNSGMAPFKLNHVTTGRVSAVKWNAHCNLSRSDPGPCPHFDGEPECFGGGDDGMEIYPSIHLSWHWCRALRWGN